MSQNNFKLQTTFLCHTEMGANKTYNKSIIALIQIKKPIKNYLEDRYKIRGGNCLIKERKTLFSFLSH